MTILSVVIAEGLLSARPSPGIRGRLFFATDVHKTFRDVVSGWDDVSSGGGANYSLPPVDLPDADGSTSYTLPAAPADPESSMYFVRGLKWKYGEDAQYTISGSTLTILDTDRKAMTGDFHELYAS